MNVLITRPLKQAGLLTQLITQAGHTPLLFPTLEVKPLDCELDDYEYDVVIFISKNAVEYGLELFESIDHDQIKVFAVGAATAKALEAHNIPVSAYPEEQASSEALLKLYSVRNLRDRNILIFRGKGGRETLKQGLEPNNNQIEYAEVYERVMAEPIDTHLKSINQFLQNTQGVITITSVENLESMLDLVKIFDESLIDELLNYPLILLSERIAKRAQELGFKQLHIASQTSDKGLLQALEAI